MLWADAIDTRVGVGVVKVYCGAAEVWTAEVPGGGDDGENLVLQFTIPLDADDTYRSQPFDAGTGSAISASSESDVPGELFVEGSDDLEAWSRLEHEVTAAGAAAFGVDTDLDHVRFGYENGPTDQEEFVLQGWVD